MLIKLPFNIKKKEEEPKVDVNSLKDDIVSAFKSDIGDLLEVSKNINEKIKNIEEKTFKIEETVQQLKETTEIHSSEIGNLKSNFDKLLSLYEVLSNSVNPFIEQPKKEKITPVEEKGHIKKGSTDSLPLDELKDDPFVATVVLGWLNFLAKKSGYEGARKALEYYRDINWITEDVYEKLLKYLRTFEDLEGKYQYLSPQDHLISLYFITRLKNMMYKDVTEYRKIYEELVEKGLLEPKVKREL